MSVQSLIIKAVLLVRRTVIRANAWARGGSAWKISAVLAVLCVLGVAAYLALRPKPSVENAPVTIRAVEVRSVAELSAQKVPLSLIGEVRSRSEASVRAEKSGQVTAVYKSLGQSVAAGAVVAEIDNASERAALQQAQGMLDAAQANLAKVEKGTRPEQLAILQTNLEGAKSGAVSALLSAYAAADSAVHGTTDKMFSNPDGPVPRFSVVSSELQAVTDVQNMRVVLGARLKREALAADSLSASSDLSVEIATTKDELRTAKEYLDLIIRVLNKGIATQGISESTIAAHLSSATAARASVSGSIASLSVALQTLQTAQKSLEQGATGAQAEDIAAARASVVQAQGSLAAVRATMEKSVIRAPISGTINSFSLNRGDYVSAGAPVLVVANNGALEIIAYLTENDVRQIAVGGRVTFEGGSGTITKIAPALDPVTKKIEVRIGVERSTDLINGQSVLLAITRVVLPVTSTSARITIPISALKIGADMTTVFTVDADRRLVAHPVMVGALLGDSVEIRSGLTQDMIIVTDARGLRTGEIVEIK